MSLADELLADLEDPGDEDELDLGGEDQEDVGMDEIEEITEDTALQDSGQAYDRVTSVARLRDSQRYKNLMGKLDEEGMDDSTEIRGPVEADPEYQLVLDINNLSVDIDNDINVIHKFVRDKYGKRFPELESLVPTPMEYMACVRELGNNVLEKVQNNETLGRILLPATVIVVSVTASTTQGEELTPEELAAVNEACDMVVELSEAKIKIFQFVEQRMGRIAPNLSAVVGAPTAARLMGIAGGLSQLSKMPACNILILGAQKRTLSGFSSTAILPHTGYIYYMPTVQNLPPDLRRKAARLVAGKCTLAARVDAAHTAPEGVLGQKFREEVERRIEKFLEPPETKKVKALPKPLDMASKKRGGRRIRKMKERLGMTEMRRKANRMTFGELEEDVLQDHMGFNLGQMKSSGPAGTIRAAQVDNKSRARMSKMLHKTVQKQNNPGGTTSVRSKITYNVGGATSVRSKMTSGTASSVTFTPVQGLEIVNPQAIEKKVAEANATYFASTSGFLKVQTPLPGSKKDA